jgi:formylglycine-generating enzyme required for sulfatase activity
MLSKTSRDEKEREAPMKSRLIPPVFIALLSLTVAAVLGGCSEDTEDPTGPTGGVGTVEIDAAPDSLDAPWTLTGPGDYSNDGTGDHTLIGLSVGDYTVTWGEVSGWTAPSAVTQTLAADGTLTFTGVYSTETGTIAIDQTPDELAGAGWTLTGPQNESGSGDTTLQDMPVGQYTLTWETVSGYTTPGDSTQSLAADGSVAFSGTYVEDAAGTGTIEIDPSPDSLDAPWTLTGPDGYSNAGTGDHTLSGLVVGDYTLTWGEVSGWTAPSPMTQTLAADGTISFTGTYTANTGTIEIDQTPDVLNGAGWTLTGPQNETGSGDTTLQDMPVGQYTLTWGEVSGWTAPSPMTQTLAADGTITFSGTYVGDPGPTAGFATLPAGTFTMGSPPTEPGRHNDETQHEVTLTTPFEIQATEVTNQQYAALAQWALDHGHVTATASSLRDALDGSMQELLDLDDSDCEISYSGGTFTVDAGMEDHPVKEVTWYGAVAYCDWLSLQAGLPRAYDHDTWQCNGHDPYGAQGYRLPTEAEWEYACRAGSETAFANGPITDTVCDDPNLDQIGWYCGNANDWTHPVAQLDANGWGLYDMHGNLWEWCNDWYDDYGGDVTDPPGPSGAGDGRVLRGGGWNFLAQGCRSAYRGNVGVPDGSYGFVGFRPARSTP